MILKLFQGYHEILLDCLLALLPLLVIFTLCQFLFLKLPKKQIVNICKGVVLSYVGLTLFLQGVTVGYIPIGEALGLKLAGLSYNWVLIPVGFLMGFAVTLAEPAVYVLVEQIEEVTGGSLVKRLMLITLCIGVAVSIALAMLKMLINFSLWYIIVPGYIIALVMSHFVDPNFTSIAFDSGGVATGTMTATFILSLTVGVAKKLEHTDPLLDGFGVIALVALTPILTVLILGLLYKFKEKNAENAG